MTNTLDIKLIEKGVEILRSATTTDGPEALLIVLSGVSMQNMVDSIFEMIDQSVCITCKNRLRELHSYLRLAQRDEEPMQSYWLGQAMRNIETYRHRMSCKHRH